MNALPILGVILGIALLLLAIPQIDVARSGIESVVSSPIALFVGILTLVLAVSGIVVAIVYGIGGRS